MTKNIKPGGQKSGTNPEGDKRRSSTSDPHRGSRVEPSHLVEQKRAKRRPEEDKPKQ